MKVRIPLALSGLGLLAVCVYILWPKYVEGFRFLATFSAQPSKVQAIYGKSWDINSSFDEVVKVAEPELLADGFRRTGETMTNRGYVGPDRHIITITKSGPGTRVYSVFWREFPNRGATSGN
jgi:hypothetical protein